MGDRKTLHDGQAQAGALVHRDDIVPALPEMLEDPSVILFGEKFSLTLSSSSMFNVSPETSVLIYGR